MQVDSLPRSIPALVLESAERFGDASAIEDGDTRLSYRELGALTLRSARACLAAGVGPGDAVGVWAPNRWEWIAAALGIQAAGGVLVTVNTRFKGGEAAYVLAKSRARLLFTLADFLDTNYVAAIREHDLPDLGRIVAFDAATDGAEAWDAFLSGGDAVSEDEARARLAAVGPDDLSDVIFTSGTTGRPKGVMTAHGQNLRAFATWCDVIGLRAGDRYLVVNPFFHSFGYKAGWMACFLRGATVLPHAVFDVPQIFQRVLHDGVSVLPGTPAVFQSFLAHPDLASHDISNLRLATIGGGAIPVELIRRMHDELGFETVLSAYGLTESCGIVSMCLRGDDAETIAATSGRAIPDVELRCVDSDGKEVPPGEPGEVVVRGYNVMRGYFDDPEETAKTIDADGWLHTGDVAVMDARGYLRITDRIKDMFIIGGLNCYPAEIEKQMYDSGLFAQVAVIGVPDERMGEVGMAWVVPAPGQDVSAEGVVAWCRANMANYKVPRSVQVVVDLPLNASGKVQKFLLRERAATLQSGA
jgi:acyl-CoA synthetase (AMP-forming)/AMP-acid ligase II